jgi:hypothetical protein
MDAHSASLFVSAVTVAEIEDGIAKGLLNDNRCNQGGRGSIV